MASALGSRLLEIREKRGVSRAHVAREAAIDVALLFRLENGTAKNPSFKTVAAVARVLNLSLDDLANPRRGRRKEPAAEIALRHLTSAMEALRGDV